MVLGVSLGGHAAWYVHLVAFLFEIHGLPLGSHFMSREDPASSYDQLDLAMLTPSFL